MNAVAHQVVECRVDHPVSLERQVPGKGRADDVHVEVALALAGMSDMEVAFIRDLQFRGRQGIRQALAYNLPDDRLTHAGSALRKGLICT